jgi:hypothetical protein
MTHAIDIVSSTRFSFRCCGNAGCLRRLRSPNSIHAYRNGFYLGRVPATGRDVTLDIALLVEYGDPSTRKSYSTSTMSTRNDLDAEQKSELPGLFHGLMIKERVGDVRVREKPISLLPTEHSASSRLK